MPWTSPTASIRERLQKPVRNIGLIAAIILLWLAYVEIVAFARLRLAAPETDIIPRSRLQAVYKHQNWVNALADEWKPSNRFDYQAYVIWERHPFEGKTINVEGDGLRHTYHSRCDPDAYTIWMFGGSTTWGAGVPDWLTVPSFLAEQYEQSGDNVCIRNYGEKAWVNTQELIKLILELKRGGRKPDLVIFYDGPADVYEVYQSGRPGVHQNFDEIKHLYEGHASEGRGGFHYLLNTNAAELFLEHRHRNQMEKRAATIDADLIARGAVRCYLDNLNFVEALAREYKFDYVFVWEPTIFNSNKSLSSDEQNTLAAANLRSPGLENADRSARQLVRASPSTHLIDVADVFDKISDTVYFDQAHVSAEGNRLVAIRIYQILQRRRP
jgi:hypothetical protein